MVFRISLLLALAVGKLAHVQAQQDHAAPAQLTPHEVQAGNHDYRPGHGFSLDRRVSGFDLALSLPASAWFDPSARGPLGRDGKDWNKAGGISYLSLWRPGSYPKNRSSALVGMRPAEGPGTFEVCAYTNAADGSWETGEVLVFSAGDTVYVSARLREGKVTYRIGTTALSQTTVHPLEPLTYAVPVGPWFGGNRESPSDHRVYTRLVLHRYE